MPKTFVCKQCSKEFVEYHDMSRERKFCSRECLGLFKRRRAQIFCAECGTQFEVIACQTRLYTYCSKECRISAFKNRALANGKTAIYTCKFCGNKFSRNIKHANRVEKHFCSRKCSGAANSNAMSGPSGRAATIVNPRDPSKHKTYTCKICGAEYQRLVSSEAHSSGYKYCSKKCADIGISQVIGGENHYNWRGGISYIRGNNWSYQTRQAKKRDKYTCQICGVYLRGSRKLHVHHIKPYRDFLGDWKSANALDNLISLCWLCHSRVENKKMSLLAT